MPRLKNLFGKNMLGKGSSRVPAFRGTTRVNFGRLLHRMHLTVGTGMRRRYAGRSGQLNRLMPHRRGQRFSFPTAEMLSDKIIGGAATRTLTLRRYQTGRSMIEILAVLAIVGILSVAAVAGLMWAFAKYRANDTIRDVHVWELAALDSNQLYDMTAGELVLVELGNTSTHGYPMAIQVQDKDVFYISVDDVPKRVCRRMLDMIDDTMLVTVNNIQYKGTNLCDADENVFAFYFNKYMGDVSNICLPACTGEERCCNNACQIIQTPCGADGCMDCGSDYCTTSNTCCPTPTATKCGDEDCCDTKCCNGVCCAESYMTCDETTTCGCPNNMVPDAQTGTCKCPDDAPYYFEEANLCCKSGYTPVDGVCQKIDCRGGPTNYNCFINDRLCGYNCNSLGRDCQNGICYADECRVSDGETFGIGILASTYYGCFKTREDGIECQSFYSNRVHWRCFTPDKKSVCCTAGADMECVNGTCDEAVCPDGFEEGNWNDISACVEKDKFVFCTLRNNTLWRCYKNHLFCGDCEDAQTCCDGKTGCIDGYTFNPTNNRCENATSYCLSNTTADKYLSGDGYQTCYTQGGEKCGLINGTSHAFTYGACEDPGCPAGMKYGKVLTIGYGCVDETIGADGMACISNQDYVPSRCYYSGKLCGQRCDLNGTNCGEVYLPQCALSGHCPQTGYDMSDGCTCDGDVTSIDGTDYCCPTGHTYTNGACAMN